MAAISITAANFRAGANAKRVKNDDGSPTVALEAFTAGALAYKADSGKYGLCDVDAALPLYIPVGVFENSGGTDQVCSIIYYDDGCTIGGATVIGKTYCAAIVAGAIVPDVDITTGGRKAVIGIGLSTTLLGINITPFVSPVI